MQPSSTCISPTARCRKRKEEGRRKAHLEQLDPLNLQRSAPVLPYLSHTAVYSLESDHLALRSPSDPEAPPKRQTRVNHARLLTADGRGRKRDTLVLAEGTERGGVKDGSRDGGGGGGGLMGREG